MGTPYLTSCVLLCGQKLGIFIGVQAFEKFYGKYKMLWIAQKAHFSPPHDNLAQMVEFVGLSGQVKFDTSGLRTQFQLDLMELQMDGLVKTSSLMIFDFDK